MINRFLPWPIFFRNSFEVIVQKTNVVDRFTTENTELVDEVCQENPPRRDSHFPSPWEHNGVDSLEDFQGSYKSGCRNWWSAPTHSLLFGREGLLCRASPPFRTLGKQVRRTQTFFLRSSALRAFPAFPPLRAANSICPSMYRHEKRSFNTRATPLENVLQPARLLERASRG